MNESKKIDVRFYRSILEQDRAAVVICNLENGEKMITENDITGILSTKITKINSDTVFMYDISSMQSLAVLYEKKTYSASDIDNILESLYRTVKNMAPYFLDVNNLIVDKDLIFMNMENGKITKENFYKYFTACDESLYINFDNGPHLPMQYCGNGRWSIRCHDGSHAEGNCKRYLLK